MNWYFYRVFLPLCILWIASLIGIASGHLQFSFSTVLVSWFLIGPIGIGVGFHRLFSHRQFVTYRPIELLLALLGTLAAYAPILFWVTNHQYHHKRSDQEQDPSSPVHHGFWESFLFYRLRESALTKVDLKNYCSKKILIDPSLRFLSRHFLAINIAVICLLLLMDKNLLLNVYLVPVLIEHLRINIVSSVAHINFPLSYRNHKTDDQSQNNYILGFLTMGFAWHNNHHHNERKLSLHDKWWEVDVEGLVAVLISKRSR